MSDHEDENYIIIERRNGNFGTFLWGLLLGAGAAILFAPKSGDETRRELRDSLDRMKEQAEERVREVQRTVTETVDDVRRQMEEGVEAARRAIDSGREAALASADEVEQRVRDSSAAFRAGYDAARSAASGAGTQESEGGDTEDAREV